MFAQFQPHLEPMAEDTKTRDVENELFTICFDLHDRSGVAVSFEAPRPRVTLKISSDELAEIIAELVKLSRK